MITRALGFTLLFSLLFGSTAALADGPALAKMMGQTQYFTHKASLAIADKNQPLTDFYLHELEEMIEELEAVESYDGHPIGQLTKAMLAPTHHSLEAALDSGDWQQTEQKLDALISSCNACHQVTEHGFIRIEKRADNPYLQSFAP